MINHFGLTVRDLDRSTEFYLRFGGRVVTDVATFQGPVQDAGVGVDGSVLRTRMIAYGSTVLELLEYVEPRGEDYALRNCDPGAAHVAFQVADLLALYDSLRGEIDFFSPPNRIADGLYTGGFWVYLRDPDGISVELLQPGPQFESLLAELDTTP